MDEFLKNRASVAGLIVILMLITAAILADFIAPYDTDKIARTCLAHTCFLRFSHQAEIN
jgi:ABC-type antimicrobial peptide transport system permease subunit